MAGGTTPEQPHSQLSDARGRKALIRAEMKERLRALSPAERMARSERAGVTLAALVERLVPEGTALAVFHATPEEITLAPVLAQLGARHPLCWPKVEGGTLTFRECSEQALEPGFRPWLLEPPATAPVVSPGALVVPGRAFTDRGARLGRGAGFYDRALSALPQGLRLGYCLAFQRVEVLPMEAHDQRVGWLVTDEGPAVRCSRAPQATDGGE